MGGTGETQLVYSDPASQADVLMDVEPQVTENSSRRKEYLIIKFNQSRDKSK